jgi:1-acyl-sn-glycerol-3-phosphate acyltransferase
MSRFGAWLNDVKMTTAGRRTAGAKRFAERVIWPWVRVAYRPELTGLEHLPRDRPFLLVANHSAGIGLAELSSFAALWVRAGLDDVPLTGFAHPVGFRTPAGRWVHHHAGSIPSTYDAAFEALADGVSVLVFPGGDYECLRPVWESNRVDFNGRVGFLRIAHQAGVPIVPMGIQGSHYTVPVLFRLDALAHLLVAPRALFGVRRWAVTLPGVLGAVALGVAPLPWPVRATAVYAWLGSPFIFLPIVPATIRFRIGAPIENATLFTGDQSPEHSDWTAALRMVEARIESLVRGESG